MSKPGMTIDAGSGLGVHLGGLGRTGFRGADIDLQCSLVYKMSKMGKVDV